MAPLHAVNAQSIRWNRSDATGHGELMTPVADKQRGLLMAGDNDEVYYKKPQRYAEDNSI